MRNPIEYLMGVAACLLATAIMGELAVEMLRHIWPYLAAAFFLITALAIYIRLRFHRDRDWR